MIKEVQPKVRNLFEFRRGYDSSFLGLLVYFENHDFGSRIENVYFAIKKLTAQKPLFKTLLEEIKPINIEIHELQSGGKSLLKAKTFLFITSRNDCNKSSKTESFTNEQLPRIIFLLPDNPMAAFKPTFFARQKFSTPVYSFFLAFVVLRTNTIPVSRTQPMTFQSGIASLSNCWLTPWCMKKQIITLIFGFERRGKSMLMAKKRTLDFSERNVSNWLSKANQIQWGNLLFQIKLTENLMEAFRLIVTAKLDFSRRSTSNLIPIPQFWAETFSVQGMLRNDFVFDNTFYKTIVIKILTNQRQLSGKFIF